MFKISIHFTPWFYEECVGNSGGIVRHPAKYQRYSVNTYFCIDDEWYPTDEQWDDFIWLESKTFPSIPMNALPNRLEYITGSSFASLYIVLKNMLNKIMDDLPIPRDDMILRLTAPRGHLQCFLEDLDTFFMNIDRKVAYIHIY